MFSGFNVYAGLAGLALPVYQCVPMYAKNDNIPRVWVFKLEALGWTNIHIRPDM